MKPKKNQLTLIGGVTYSAGPYIGEIREGRLHISHVSDPEHIIEKITSEPHEAQAHMERFHKDVQGSIR